MEEGLFASTHTAIQSTYMTTLVPEEIDVFGRRRGNTFSWQPPRVTNGVVTGFDVQVVCHLGDSATVTETLALDPMEFCFSPVDLPHPCDSVTVQVTSLYT